MTTITPDSMVQRWTDPKARPLFKGSLIDDDGCKCAQGDVLACAGWTDDQLRELSQNNADMEVAKVLGISTAHAILLRGVNDKKDGCPQDVLAAPEKILGDQAGKLLAFWLHLDRMTCDDWEKVAASWDSAGAAARAAAGDAARAAAEAASWTAAGADARAAAGDAARAAAGGAAGVAAWAAAGAAAWFSAEAAAGDVAGAAAWTAAEAANEIQGAAIMRKQGQPFFFLPMFGINDPEEAA